MKVTPVGRKFGRYLPGEEFEMADKLARAFVRVGKLREVVAAVAESVVVAAVVADPAAQDEPAKESEQQEESAEISPRTGLPKRQYRRRDLTAEG